MSLTSSQFTAASAAASSGSFALGPTGSERACDGPSITTSTCGASQQQPFSFEGDIEFPRFSESEIKSSLKAEAEKHPTWKTAAVKKMKIVNIDTSVVFKYTLETFTESRSTYEVAEPCRGQNLNPNVASSMVSVWDVVCTPNQMFAEETQIQEMPGSSFLQKCDSCKGHTESSCFHCRNAGTIRCNACNGTGMRTGVPHPLFGPAVSSASKATSHRKPIPGTGTPIALGAAGMTAMDLCQQCHGQGTKQCSHCKGQGKTICGNCRGYGQHRVHTALKIRFELDKIEHLHDPPLPDEIMQRVRGEVILMETGQDLSPMKNFPIEGIKDASRLLIQSHLAKHTGSAKVLQQRHMLQAIPVAKVTYDFNGQKGFCWVVGLERLAYVPQYPKKCSIL